MLAWTRIMSGSEECNTWKDEDDTRFNNPSFLIVQFSDFRIGFNLFLFHFLA